LSTEAIRRRVLEGNVRKSLLVLATPILINQIVQVLYNLVDTFWLGRLGRAAVSAPAVAWPVMMTAMLFASGFTAAGTALISQLVGARRYEEVDTVLGQLILVEVLVGTVLGIAGYFLAVPLFRLLHVPYDVLPLSSSYLQVLSLVFPFVSAGLAMSAAFRALGDTKTPTIVGVTTLILNAVLDPLLIFGWAGLPKLGVVGAALSTSVSSILYAMTLMSLFLRGYRGIRLSTLSFAPRRAILYRVLRIGTPSALSNALTGLSFAVVMAIVASFGTVATAAYGVGMRISNVISGLVFGISQAAGVIVGQSVGARLVNRARRALLETIRANILITAVLSVLIFLFAPHIVAMFISDPVVIAVGALFLRIFLPTLPLVSITVPVILALRAAGKTHLSALLGIVQLWVIRIPLAYLFGAALGIVGVWWGLSLTNVISAAIAAYFLLNTKWLRPIV